MLRATTSATYAVRQLPCAVERIVRRGQRSAAPAGAASEIILLRGGGTRLQTASGALLVAASAGFRVDAPMFEVRVACGDAFVLEGHRTVEIAVDSCARALVVAIIPEPCTLELAGRSAHRRVAPRPCLFPQAHWRLPRDLLPLTGPLEQWWQDDQAALELTIWADRLLAACLAEQADFDDWVARCTGRNWASKQAMLVRLLRARIAMRVSDKVSVAEAAELALLSPSGFIKHYREVFGETPARSSSRHRLEQACAQLESRSRTVEEVAKSVGYHNRSSFTRAFKAKFGCCPGSVRLRTADARGLFGQSDHAAD